MDFPEAPQEELTWIGGRDANRLEVKEIQYHVTMPDYPSTGEHGVAHIIAAGQLDHNQLFALHHNVRVQSKTVPGPAINCL